MSQEKVERYKQEKAHRKENVEKERRKKKAGRILTWVIILAVCGGIGGAIGVTFYNDYQAKLAARPNYAREEMVVSDLTGILQETEAETAAE